MADDVNVTEVIGVLAYTGRIVGAKAVDRA